MAKSLNCYPGFRRIYKVIGFNGRIDLHPWASYITSKYCIGLLRFERLHFLQLLSYPGRTNLNHFGYKLDRNSVPLCFNVTDSDEEGLRKCFMAEGHLRKFQWATRNFNVPPSVVENFISEFVLHNELICSDMQKRAEKNGFVLYNAYCRNGTNQHHKLHADHFFTNDGKKDSKKMAK